MRPDEYKQQDAERWTEAVQLRNAIEQGRAGAWSEKLAREQMAREQPTG